MTDSTTCPELLSYAEGELEPALRRRIEEHIRTCGDCRRWLQTYRDLSGTLNCTHQAPSELLAEYAVGAHRIDEVDRARLVQHLEGCDQCRGELDLARSALESARRESVLRDPVRITIRGRFLNPARAAIAASAVVLSTAAIWLFVAGPTRMVPSEFLSTRGIEGEQVSRSGVTMVIANTSIRKGGVLAIRARGPVAFGNGFSVGTGARLSVEILQDKPVEGESSAESENSLRKRRIP